MSWLFIWICPQRLYHMAGVRLGGLLRLMLPRDCPAAGLTLSPAEWISLYSPYSLQCSFPLLPSYAGHLHQSTHLWLLAHDDFVMSFTGKLASSVMGGKWRIIVDVLRETLFCQWVPANSSLKGQVWQQPRANQTQCSQLTKWNNNKWQTECLWSTVNLYIHTTVLKNSV